MAQTSEGRRTGRPRAEDAPVTVERILDAAFRAFATYGYDGVAVRTLNRELGVSHNLIHQRFGSKQGLWYAAVDRAFRQQVTQLATAFDPTLVDPLDQLNHAIRRFVRYSAERPELLGLMNIEARIDSERLDYIYETYVAPALEPLGRLLDHLRANGRIRPISLRALFFLIAHGAAAPFTLAPLGRRFDNTDPLAPRQVAEQAALTADVITNGLRLNAPGENRGS
ncbi:MAG: TetR/AcrR family transcriptional regulator [Solirubrobacteraceae bacterium]|jgi:TetR/AcrR family transcriptional regulator|nr:TetR/AcrR family transcriptional regulator [Solirubrobacteraceae bacterium]